MGLESLGYVLIRSWSNYVMNNINKVFLAIEFALYNK